MAEELGLVLGDEDVFLLHHDAAGGGFYAGFEGYYHSWAEHGLVARHERGCFGELHS